SLLGPPDETSPGTREGREVWRYGVNRPGGFPTLGQVVLNERGRVEVVQGAAGAPPAAGLFREDELRTLLRTVDELRTSRRRAFLEYPDSPQLLIRVANRLLPLGKEKVIALLREYVRLCYFQFSSTYEVYGGPPYSLFHLAAALFQPSQTPEYPHLVLWIQDGIPLWPEFHGGLAGSFGHLSYEELDFYRDKAQLRPKPLTPTIRPMETLDRLQSAIWEPEEAKRLQAPEAREDMMEHLLRLVETVYRPERDGRGDVVRGEQDVEAWWRSVVADVGKLNIRWDSRKGEYTFANGRQLPPLPATSTAPRTPPG
ncbi:MAG TPA: hypothetical protein VK689_22370, partial [Armatimonadota bacterium]|nr:hypothetical protein [Armatimonadota bacterium]